MGHSKSKRKALICSTFAFLLTLLFFSFFLCMGLGFGVFNRKNVASKFNESDYYNEVYHGIYDRSEEIVRQADLPEAVIQDVITQDRVYVGINNYINASLAGEDPLILTDKMISELKDHINGYLTEQDVERTNQVNASEEVIVNKIIKEYQGRMKVPFVDYFVKYNNKFWNLMKIILPSILLLAGVLCFFLLRMHKNKHRGLRYINYSMISSSLLILLLSVGILSNKGYERLNVMPLYYRDFLQAYLKRSLQVIFGTGGIGIIIAVILISLTGFLKSQNTNS